MYVYQENIQGVSLFTKMFEISIQNTTHCDVCFNDFDVLLTY